MALDPINQSIEQFKPANNILIVVGETNNADSLAAALALRRFLIKLEKQITVLSTSSIPSKLKFLSDISDVKTGTALSKNLVIDLSLVKTQVGEMRYQKFDDKLSIFLTAKEGEFSADDVKVRASVYPFDLIVTVGIPNLEMLGSFYSANAQLFFDNPVINIDFKPSNEKYGQINLVELTASSSSEIVFDLLSEYDKSFIDEGVATLLLTGLIGQTNSFQTVKTSPQVFLKASTLINLGAKQQEIISSLYRSKSMGLLRLWGRVLARLKEDTNTKLVYSLVTNQDVEKSEATNEDVEQIIYEMMQQLPFAKTFMFLCETANNQTDCFVASLLPVNLQNILSNYQLTDIGQAIKFTISKPLVEATEELVTLIQQELNKLG